jgi:hypothetical protein
MIAVYVEVENVSCMVVKQNINVNIVARKNYVQIVIIMLNVV